MPMLLRKPAPTTIRTFLDAQASLPFTYPAVGASATTPPPGYAVDHTRILLGQGEPVFIAAKAALQRWQHFHLGWVEAHPRETTIHPGAVVAVLARAMSCWWLN